MKYTFIITFLFLSLLGYGQSYYWGVKGGPTIGTQAWNGDNQRDPLISYQGDLFYETISEEGSSAFFMSGGLHVRGSKIITRASTYTNSAGMAVSYPSTSTSFQFRNITVILGIKKYFASKLRTLYYDFGLRAEYNISNNLTDYNSYIFSAYYPIKDNVNKFVYGLTLGGGIDIPLNEKVSTFFEIGFNQDISRQYFRNVIKYATDYNGNVYSVPEQSIRNFSVDITFGVKFLRKIVYYD
jgi:Outer membrane protein beta-barrel domain